MEDFTFRNISCRLYADLGHWAARSFSIRPYDEDLLCTWMSASMLENFKTTTVNDGFDTFMLRLLLAKDSAHRALRDRISSTWSDMSGDNADTLDSLAQADFDALSDPA